MNVSFNPLAEQELNDAAQYYELESLGLGDALLTVRKKCWASYGVAVLSQPSQASGRKMSGAICRIPVRPFVNMVKEKS